MDFKNETNMKAKRIYITSEIKAYSQYVEGHNHWIMKDRNIEPLADSLMNLLPMHFVGHCKPQEMPTIKVKEITGYSLSQTNVVNEFCETHNIISVTPQITNGNNKYLVVYYA